MAMRKDCRPFNVEQAKAGAPYGHRQENTEVKIYEYFDDKVIGAYKVKTNSDWSAGEWGYKEDYLVMLPIATCQGNPVYVGDTLYDANGERFEVEVGHTASMLGECTWDGPVKRVETRMTDIELGQAYNNNGSTLKGVVNAAIARAIEDGDVVPMDVVEEIAAHARKQGEETYLSDEDVWNEIRKKFLKDQ